MKTLNLTEGSIFRKLISFSLPMMIFITSIIIGLCMGSRAFFRRITVPGTKEASVGAILLLAGKKREMLPHTRIMIHDSSYGHLDVGGKKIA